MIIDSLFLLFVVYSFVEIRALAHLYIFGKRRILCVLRGETPQHIFGGPGHILILMGVFLIPAFRLWILGLTYKKGPRVDRLWTRYYGCLLFII